MRALGHARRRQRRLRGTTPDWGQPPNGAGAPPRLNPPRGSGRGRRSPVGTGFAAAGKPAGARVTPHRRAPGAHGRPRRAADLRIRAPPAQESTPPLAQRRVPMRSRNSSAGKAVERLVRGPPSPCHGAGPDGTAHATLTQPKKTPRTTKRSTETYRPRPARQPRRRSTTRTSTRVGRVGGASERKSRTAAECRQKPQPSGSPGANGTGGATGASQSGQASVPRASSQELAVRLFSCRPPTRPIGSPRSGSEPSIPRWNATTKSLGKPNARERQAK
jgi:hypothetical protein